jgi:hypothetical protein
MTLEIPDEYLKDRTKFRKVLETKLKIAGCYFLLDETIDNFIKTYENKEHHGDSFSYKIKV